VKDFAIAKFDFVLRVAIDAKLPKLASRIAGLRHGGAH
jgi:hypothetical protein